MIFQALGARYTFGSAVQHLFAHGTPKDTERLRAALAERYSGKVTLYRKGRAALSEAIRVATGGQGSVAISALTCYSVVQAVEAAGCTPVYVDIREEDLHFGANELAKTIDANADIKAVVVQNMLGIPADITGIQEVANRHNLILIEDLAHSAGASYANGREVGTVGDITMLSFGRDKAIDTVNGGALVIRSSTLTGASMPDVNVRTIDQVRDRLYPSIAWTTRALYPVKVGLYVMAAAIKFKLVVRSADGEVKTSERLTNWQAKLALVQFRSLEQTAKNRRDNARLYSKELHHQVPSGVEAKGAAPVRVPLIIENREEVIAHLKKNGVQANDIWYDVPVSPVRFYSKSNYPEDKNPVAVRIAASLINLPTHERLTKSQIIRIAALVNEVAR